MTNVTKSGMQRQRHTHTQLTERTLVLVVHILSYCQRIRGLLSQPGDVTEKVRSNTIPLSARSSKVKLIVLHVYEAE